MSFVVLLIALTIIPLFGYVVSYFIINHVNNSLSSSGMEFKVSEVCTSSSIEKLTDAVKSPDFINSIKELCDSVSDVILTQQASIISGIIAILLPSLFLLLSFIAGTNRRRVAYIFPPLIFISLFFLSCLTLVQGAILVYGAYLT